MLAPWKKSYDQPRQYIKKQRHYFTNKGPSSQSYGFTSSHVWMWELDHKEGWAPKNWCFWTVVLEKTLESPLNYKEIKSVNLKGNQCWIFIGGLMLKLNLSPVLWPSDAKNGLIGKDPDAGKDWRQEQKGLTEDEMVGWHHWLDGREFEQVPWVSDGQRSLAGCRPWLSQSWTQLSNWTTATCCLYCFGALNDIMILGSYCTVSEQTINENMQAILCSLWHHPIVIQTSQVALVVKNPPAKAGDIRDTR